MAVKQNIKGDYIYCHACCTKIKGLNNKGRVRSEQHRLLTGLASNGRKPSALAITKSRERFTGASNPNWIKDRDLVARNERARKESYSLVHNCIKRLDVKKGGKTQEILGYSGKDLITHIEKLFVDGMGWHNRNLWHIDHIKPVAQFVKEGISDLRIINSLSNLHPLWAMENLKKNDQWNQQ